MRNTMVHVFRRESHEAQALVRVGQWSGPGPVVSTSELLVRAQGLGPDVEVLLRRDGDVALVTRDGPERACARLAQLGVAPCSCGDDDRAPRVVVDGVALEPDRAGGQPVPTIVAATSDRATLDLAARTDRAALVAAAIRDVLDPRGGARFVEFLGAGVTSLHSSASGGSSPRERSTLNGGPSVSRVEVVDLAPCWWGAVPDGLADVDRVPETATDLVEVVLSPTSSGGTRLACAFDGRRHYLSSVEDLLSAVTALMRSAGPAAGPGDGRREGPVLVGPSVQSHDLTGLLARVAARRSGRVVLSDHEVAWDWGNLDERVRTIIDGLARHGVRAGVRVGVRAVPTASYVASLLAVWTCGATAVPYGEGANARDRTIVGSVSVLLDDGRVRLSRPVVTDVDPDVAFVAHTSGSTGQPKPVPVARDALATYATSFAQELALGPADLLVGANAPMFDGFLEQVLAPLVVGARVHLADAYGGVPELVDLLVSTGATVLDLPTALWRVVADYLDALDEPMPAGLRAVVIGGEAYEADRASRFLARGRGRLDLVSTYGPVECTISATLVRVPQRDVEVVRPLLGRPMAGAVVAVVDDAGRSAVEGTVGEICIGGYGVSPGVPVVPIRDPSTGREIPMYRTGDLGRVRPDRSLEYFGRRDDEVKVRGYRVAPAEVRRALLAVDGVTDAAVLGVPGPDGGVELGAVVTGSGRIGESDVAARLRDVLPHYLVPTRLKVVASLPVNDVGKTDRGWLLTLLAEA